MLNRGEGSFGKLAKKFTDSPEWREKLILFVIVLTFLTIAVCEFYVEHKPQFLAIYLIPSFLTFFLGFNARKSRTILIVGAISTVLAVADITLIHPNNFEQFDAEKRWFTVAFVALLQFAVCYFSVRQARILGSEQQKRVSLERRQRYLRRLNSEIAENAPVAIAQLNAKLKYEMVNPLYLKLMRQQSGNDALELAGKNLRDYRALHIAEEEWQAAVTLIQKGQPVKFRDQLSVAKVSGTISYYDWTIWPVQDEKGTTESVLLLGADVTERIRGKRELEAALSELEKSNHAKDTFLATLSHELRTPLTPILGWARMIQELPSDDAIMEKGLQAIERNARLQSQLVDDLLDLSRIAMGKVELTFAPVDFNEIVRRALETVQYQAEAQMLDVEVALAPEALPINCDSTRMEQVIWNLLVNAAKFTPLGGKVTITTRQVEAQVYLEVQDSGIGIDAQFLPMLFEPFKQADSRITRQHGGLGIGLAIAKSLIELHGGVIKANSQGRGQGACFTVRLPLLSASLRAPGNDVQMILPPFLAQTKVLVLEDSFDTRELLGMMLRAHGCDVCLVGSVVEAMQKILPFGPDVIISDIGLPEADGYEFADQVRRLDNFRHTPMIALTGYAMEADKQKALQSGFTKHLSKPLDPVLLINAIHSLLDRPPIKDDLPTVKYTSS